MIDGVQTKKLKVIPDERGFLMEMMRADDEFFQRFGQVYLSVCDPGYAKGWHYHKVQTDHFVVVKGQGRVVLYDQREESPTHGEIQEFSMGERNPILLVIPPYVLHGITPDGDEPCYLINVPTEMYKYDEPDEYRVPFDDPSIGYDWGVTQGG